MKRRTVIGALGALGSGAWAACGGSSPSAADADADAGPDRDAGRAEMADQSAASCNVTPDETAGPYVDQTGMVANPTAYRSNITEGKPGAALSLELTIVDVSKGCAPIVGATVEVWHCDAAGVYSEYVEATNPGSTDSTYLRGLQKTDAAGRVTFKTIYPGWYAPRAPHVHVRVHDGVNLKATTQLGFPDAISAAIYAGGGAYTKGPSPTLNDDDSELGVGTMPGTGRGGHEFQLATVTGDDAQGRVAKLVIGLPAF